MILLDVNVLVYATNRDAMAHAPAKAWLDEVFSSPTRVGIPWATILGFLRVTPNGRIFRQPLGTVQAWAEVQTWLARDLAWIPEPTERHAGILGGLLAGPGIVGNLIADPHLAALAIEHGLTRRSTDGDFARFKSLRWMNPLQP